MACPLNHDELSEFHFGARSVEGLERATRTAEHLMACPTCLAEFFTFKLAVERGLAADERPSLATRRAVIGEAARRLQPQRRASRVIAPPRLARRLGAVGAVAAAVWLAIATIGRHEPPPEQPAAHSESTLEPPSGLSGQEAIDTGRERPANIHII